MLLAQGWNHAGTLRSAEGSSLARNSPSGAAVEFDDSARELSFVSMSCKIWNF